MSTRAQKKYKIPFRRSDGSLIRWLDPRVYTNGVDTEDVLWADVIPWKDGMRIGKEYKGRSAHYYSVNSVTTGIRYWMSAHDIVEWARYGTIVEGVLVGIFVGNKKGQNYGIELYKE